MQDLKNQVQALTAEEWQQFLGWVVGDEKARRDAQPAVEQAQAEIMAEVWETQPELKPAYVGTVDPETPTLDALLAQLPEWVQPTSKASAYPPASLVQHDGKAWRNRRRGLNSAEPGTPFSGWEDVTNDLLKPAPVQDGNAEDADTTDAPGLITQPEPEKITPAPQVQDWAPGLKIEAGIPWRHDGQIHIAKINHTSSPTNAPGKSTRHWQPLPA